jgi:hypothetical protein
MLAPGASVTGELQSKATALAGLSPAAAKTKSRTGATRKTALISRMTKINFFISNLFLLILFVGRYNRHIPKYNFKSDTIAWRLDHILLHHSRLDHYGEGFIVGMRPPFWSLANWV